MSSKFTKAAGNPAIVSTYPWFTIVETWWIAAVLNYVGAIDPNASGAVFLDGPNRPLGRPCPGRHLPLDAKRPLAEVGRGLPQPLDYMPYALLTDPAAPGHLYTGLSNGDVCHTADYGDSWQQLPLNLGRIARSMIMLQEK